jgi:nucleotide-binding universal stress UspA family protein
MAPNPVYRRILLPVDGSLSMLPLVYRCLAFAADTDARVVALHVTPLACTDGAAPACADCIAATHASLERAARILEEVAGTARALGVQCDCMVLTGAQPWEVIVQAAISRHADLICMGSHGRHGVAEQVLASQAQRVLEHTQLPVLLFR